MNGHVRNSKTQEIANGSSDREAVSPADCPPILVVDDDRTFRHVLRTLLTADGFDVSLASNAAECVAWIEQAKPGLILLDLNLPDGNGIDVLKRVRSLDAELPIILMTASGDSESAIMASRFGARDFLTKPLDLNHLRRVVDRVLAIRSDRSVSKSGAAIRPLESRDPLVGKSDEMQEVFKSIGRVARQPVSVLIRGESGTGKELVARSIWRHSDRANAVFMAINCAALSDELLESELFGHEQGAYTGARQQHVGRFEACSGGTLFLDEIGDTRPAFQAKLLRVLQERRLVRVGGDTEIPVDVRIISATNRPLETMLRRGRFREDLFHRLNGFTIHLPALRDRGGDIRILLAHFLHRYNRKLSKAIGVITNDAAERLEKYSWPGNVRELESLLSQMMLNDEDSVIDTADLPAYVSAYHEASTTSQSTAQSEPAPSSLAEDQFGAFVDAKISGSSHNLYAETLEFMERYLIQRVLRQTEGNQSAAARRLGITRGSLRFKLKNLGLSINSRVSCGQSSNR